MTYFDYAELERCSMRLDRLVLEVEGMNEVDVLAVSEVVFWNPLSK